MRLFQAALDTPLDSPFSGTLSVHGLHFTVCTPSKLGKMSEPMVSDSFSAPSAISKHWNLLFFLADALNSETKKLPVPVLNGKNVAKF